MEANWVFEMQRNYIAFQTPRCFSQCIHILQIPILQDGKRVRVRSRLVKEKILIDWELWVVGKQFVFM